MLPPDNLFPFQVLTGGRVFPSPLRSLQLLHPLLDQLLLRVLVGFLLMEIPGFRAHLTALVLTLMGKVLHSLVFPRLTHMGFLHRVCLLRGRVRDLSFLTGVVFPWNLEFLGDPKLSALVPMLPRAKHLFLLLFR